MIVMNKVLILSPSDQKIKNVVRDFVYGCWCRGRRIGGMQMPPLNLLYVATVLKENGIDAELVDVGLNYDQYDDVKKRINEFAAVIILSSTNSFQNDVEALKEIKSLNSEIKTILFGSHPTFMPEYCIKETVVDILVFKEPEFIIRDVVKKIINKENYMEIKGIGYNKDGRLVKNDDYPFIAMDELPIPDRTLLPKGLDYFNPVIKQSPYTTMQTSRGCPGKCNFCTVPNFYGKKIRLRSVENVIDEIKSLIALGYKEIFFRDETFTAYKNRNRDICNRIIDENIDISWIANGRVDLIDFESMSLMKKAGCHMIKLGVESGNQFILDNLNKGIFLEQTKQVFKWCRDLKLDAHAHVMLGSPGETKETIKKTIAFVKSLKPATASFGLLTPYPGTEIFDKVAASHPEIKDGSDATLEKLHISGYFNEYFSNVHGHELEKCVSKAYRSIYLRPSYIAKRLLSINSFSELMRLIIAGTNIFNFSVTGKN